MFHLFICANLVVIIPTPNFLWLNRRGTRLQHIYFTTFEILQFAILSYLLYRFVWLWSNTSGQCFIAWPDGTGSPEEMVVLFVRMAFSAALMIPFIMASLVDINRGVPRRSQEETGTAAEVQDVEATTIDGQKPQDTTFWTKRKKHVLIFLGRFFARWLLSIWGTYLVMEVVRANRAYMLGDEYIFSFGQVAALVAFAASLYKIGNSFFGKPCVPS